MNNSKGTLPAWWPACPYPVDIFPMNLDRYAEIVPDEDLRTALSGALGRHFWEVASAEIWRSYQLQAPNGRADGRLPDPDWRQAPGWAQWWAMDRDGKAWWYAQRPGLRPGTKSWTANDGEVARCYVAWSQTIPLLAIDWHALLSEQWQNSLRQRPQATING